MSLLALLIADLSINNNSNNPLVLCYTKVNFFDYFWFLLLNSNKYSVFVSDISKNVMKLKSKLILFKKIYKQLNFYKVNL